MTPKKQSLREGLKLRFPKYKKVPTLMPHCSICKEPLKGDGSISFPYSCSCGEWKADYTGGEFKGFYKIKIKTL